MNPTIVFAAWLLALSPAPQQSASSSMWTVPVPGIAVSPPLTAPMRSAHRPIIVMHNYAVGQGTARDVPVPGCTLMELRAGFVFTTIAGQKQPRLPGDSWTLDTGTVITFENPYPDAAAIIRVTTIEMQP